LTPRTSATRVPPATMDATAERKLLREIARQTNERNRRELDALRQHQADRLRRARDEARRLTEAFRAADPEIGRVVLFGSVATGDVGSREFDIDLAVHSREYLRLVSVVLDSPFRVDLVDLDAVREPMRRAIERDGKVLYAKDQGTV
jgi:predicted nucleotidyltransferase